MYVICSDLESIYVPEIWVSLAKKTGIKEFNITTREEPDYDKLMKRRIEILKENNIKLKNIQEVLAEESPFLGAKDFLGWLSSVARLIVVSDTFVEFANPWMKKLGNPILFCNSLIIGKDGFIKEHVMRQDNGKKKVVDAIRSLNYKVIAYGDSYNDINMLMQADHGILYCPPDTVKEQFPQFPVAYNYSELKEMISKILTE